MITANPIVSPENSVASVYRIGEELRQSLQRVKLRYLDDAIQDIAIRAWLEPERLTTTGQIAKALKNRIVDLQRADVKQQIHAENRGERPAEKEPIVSVLVGNSRARLTSPFRVGKRGTCMNHQKNEKYLAALF